MAYLSLVSILTTVMFFLSGAQKVRNIDKVATGLQKRFPIKSLPFNFFRASIVGVILLQIFAPVLIVYSIAFDASYRKLASIASVALAIFTVLATLLYHFPPKGKEYYPFISNVTTTGGLLLLAHVLNNNRVRLLMF
jgi:uncharacterized membrane protein YphA (DoxX/SURF4 family)